MFHFGIFCPFTSLPFFQICLNFPKKLREKKFFSDDYILMRGNIRKITQKTNY